ncbi:MAG TPA: hypothetical protein VF538_13610 [Pyrinomonadaceae bacterium]|jgi:hypothetical protein
MDGGLFQNIELHRVGAVYLGTLSMLRGNRMVTYRFTRAVVEHGNLPFDTTAARGVSYRFEGRFTRGDFAGDAARRGEEVVEGILEWTVMKLPRGRETGTAELKFDFPLGG